jgi:CRISPR-associated protein Cas5t
MNAAKVCIRAPITSFRYPHFLIGRQVTFEMPAPSTIYGHVASAVGDWVDPKPLRFAYHFTFVSKGADLEHQHIIWAGRPDKLSKEESAMLKDWQRMNALAVGGAIQPTPREFLFDAQLTLYLQPATLESAFRSPLYPVVLGRSQDLAEVISADTIDLVESSSAYFENTLLPYWWRTKTGFGTTLLMPRYITPPPERESTFERYVALRAGDRIFGGDVHTEISNARRLLRFENEPEEWLIDPTAPADHGIGRGVVFHSFVD